MDKADLMLYNKAYNNAPDEGATPEDDRTVQPGMLLARSPGAASRASLVREKPGHKRPGGPVRNNKDETSTFCLPRQYPKKPRKSLLYQRFSSLKRRVLHHNYTICERALM